MPSQVISDINPNSLGQLQPIRAANINVSIPDPLNPAPFFQAQQVLQNRRRMDQEDLMMKFREKQLEFQETAMIWDQTKEFIALQNQAFNDYYGEHTASKAANSSGIGGMLGLDPRYNKTKEILDRHSGKFQALQEEISKQHEQMWTGGKKPDAASQSQILRDFAIKSAKLKQEVLFDPEYRKYALNQRNWEKFNDDLAAARKAGYSIDQNKVNKIIEKYENTQNGTIKDNDLKNEFSVKDVGANILDYVTFDDNKAEKDLDDIRAEVNKPLSKVYRYNQDIPGVPGMVREEEVTTIRDKAESLRLAQEAAALNPNIVKMFEAATGVDFNAPGGIGKPSGRELFNQFIEKSIKVGIPDGGEYITASGETIYDPQKALASKATSLSSANSLYGDKKDLTQDEAAANSVWNGYKSSGLNLTGPYGTEKAARTIATTPEHLLEKRPDPKTGIIKIYKKLTDKDGVVQEDDKGNPIWTEIGTLTPIPKEQSQSNKIKPGDEVYSAYAVDSSVDGRVAPALSKGELTSFRQDMSQRWKTERNPLVTYFEQGEGNSLAANEHGARGRYQFQGAKKDAFLESIKDKTGGKAVSWEEAYRRLGDAQFKLEEDAFYENNILSEANNYTIEALNNAGMLDNFKHFDVLKHFLGSMANQHGQWKTIVNRAVSNLKNSKETVDDYTLLEELYKERVKYMHSIPVENREKQFKDDWNDAGVNRHFKEYIAVKDRLNSVNYGEDYQTETIDYQTAQAPPAPAATPVTGQAQSSAATGQSATEAYSSKTVKDRVIDGEEVSDDEYLELAQEMGLNVDSEFAPGFGFRSIRKVSPGTSTLGLNRAELKLTSDRLEDLYRKKEDKGEELPDLETFKKQDRVYSGLLKEIKETEDWIKSNVEKLKPKIREMIIAEKYPQASEKSQQYSAKHIIKTIESWDGPISLESLEKGITTKGTITESKIPGEYVYEVNGQKTRIKGGPEGLAQWLKQNAPDVSIALFPPSIIAVQEGLDKEDNEAAPTESVEMTAEDKVNAILGVKKQ